MMVMEEGKIEEIAASLASSAAVACFGVINEGARYWEMPELSSGQEGYGDLRAVLAEFLAKYFRETIVD